MPSWRETTPQEIQDELDLVVDDALKGARSHLQSDGLFTYSVTLNTEWGLGYGGAGPGLSDPLARLRKKTRAYRDSFRAVAFVADVDVDGGRAVRVEAEHRDGGPALIVLMPYTLKELDGPEGRLKNAVIAGELRSLLGERHIWT